MLLKIFQIKNKSSNVHIEMIFHFLYFFIFLQDSRGNIIKHLNLTSNETVYDLIGKWLEYPLTNLPHLHLQLCVDNLNANMEFLYTMVFETN